MVRVRKDWIDFSSEPKVRSMEEALLLPVCAASEFMISSMRRILGSGVGVSCAASSNSTEVVMLGKDNVLRWRGSALVGRVYGLSSFWALPFGSKLSFVEFVKVPKRSLKLPFAFFMAQSLSALLLMLAVDKDLSRGVWLSKEPTLELFLSLI